MKTPLLLSLWFAAFCVSPMGHAQHPDQAGYWPLDAIVAGTARDASGYGSHATTIGTGTGLANGQVCNAFTFTGSSYLECEPESSHSVTDNITIALWMKIGAWPTGYAVHPVNKWTNTSDANYVFYLFGDQGGGAAHKIGFYANAGGVWKGLSPLFAPNLNTWYHVVWTYSSTAGGKLYINGVLTGSTVPASGTLSTNRARLRFGSAPAGGFTGSLDDIQIRSRALTAPEVLNLYNDSLVSGYWNLHRTAGDFSGSFNDGVQTGTGTTLVSGQAGNAFNFSGSGGVDCGNGASLNIADKLTIELWIKPSQFPAGYAVHPLNKWVTTTDANYVMYLFGDGGGGMAHKIAFYANAGGVWRVLSPDFTPTLGTWYHVVWTYDSATGGLLYVNGAQVGSAVGAGAGALAASAATLKFANNGFVGAMDEVKIHRRVLTPTEVTASYNDHGTLGGTLQTSNLRLTMNGTGSITELTRLSTGVNYSGGTVPFAAVTPTVGATTNANRILFKNGRYLVDFDTANVTAEVALTASSTHFSAQVVHFYGDTANVKNFRLLCLNPSLLTYQSSLSGIRADANFGLCLRGANPLVHGTGFVQVYWPYPGIEGAKSILAGETYANLRNTLKTVLGAERMPGLQFGGPWAQDNAINRDSYLWARVSSANVGQWITLAQNAGMNIIHFHPWWKTNGHYEPDPALFTDLNAMKAAVDQIHAAGLRVGIHCLTGSISTNDDYVRTGDSRLAADAEYDLSTALSGTGGTGQTVTVSDLSVPPDTTAGTTLQIDNELITYTGTSGNSFTGCTRGAYNTTVAAHAVGAAVKHLHFRYGTFYCDIDSTLAAEVATNIATVANTCNVDLVYMDNFAFGPGFTQSNSADSRMRKAIMERISHPVRVEHSDWLQYCWPFHSSVGAWDTLNYATKKGLDTHTVSNDAQNKGAFFPTHLGWWRFNTTNSDTYSQLPDEVEYLCAKLLGWDSSLSVQGTDPVAPAHGRQAEYLALVKSYETRRLNQSVPAGIRTQLQASNQDFRLLANGSFIKRAYPTQKVTGLSDGSNSWTVTNNDAAQPTKLRVRALHAAAAYTGSNVLLSNFASPSEFQLSNATGVTSSLTVANNIGTLTATNNNGTNVGAWAKFGKVFNLTPNISGYEAIGVWVYGDNKGEVLNLQYQGALPYTYYDDHYITVNFTGWKYFELFIRERDARRFYDYVWPYVPGYAGLHRNPVNRTAVENLNIYYNNIPAGQQVSCQIQAVKALPASSVWITNPSVTVNGGTLTFLTTLNSGEYLELNSLTDCKKYDTNGAYVGTLSVSGSVPTLNAGANAIQFGGTGTSGYSTRAEVTFFIDGPVVQ